MLTLHRYEYPDGVRYVWTSSNYSYGRIKLDDLGTDWWDNYTDGDSLAELYETRKILSSANQVNEWLARSSDEWRSKFGRLNYKVRSASFWTRLKYLFTGKLSSKNENT